MLGWFNEDFRGGFMLCNYLPIECIDIQQRWRERNGVHQNARPALFYADNGAQLFYCCQSKNATKCVDSKSRLSIHHLPIEIFQMWPTQEVLPSDNQTSRFREKLLRAEIYHHFCTKTTKCYGLLVLLLEITPPTLPTVSSSYLLHAKIFDRSLLECVLAHPLGINSRK